MANFVLHFQCPHDKTCPMFKLDKSRVACTSQIKYLPLGLFKVTFGCCKQYSKTCLKQTSRDRQNHLL